VKSTETRLEVKESSWRSEDGRSVVETLIVVVIAAILMSLAVPQMLSGRRLMRSSVMPREVLAQLRFARQQAMSQRQAFTFQYDDSAKTIRIFDHNNVNNANASCNMSGSAVLSAGGYPTTACTTTTLTVPLSGAGLPASEISYGVPGTITNSNLSDASTLTALVGNVVNITFQSDGTVVDSSNNYVNRSLFFYNNRVPTETAAAISVLGAAGRIKLWRYSTSASQYAE